MHTLLIANRGEIARRIIRTAKQMGIGTVIPYTQADAHTTFVREADVAVRVDATMPARAYLDADELVRIAVQHGADSVHPGYGFLSESAALAQACVNAGLAFVGPTVETITSMGSKVTSKRLAELVGIPVLGSVAIGGRRDPRSSEGLIFPLLIKASAGGGGRGIRLVRDPDEFASTVDDAIAEAQSLFGDGTIFAERFLDDARHVEVQVFGDTFGAVVHLGERECSVQRRHQKLIEESPSVTLGAAMRERICSAAVALAREVDYVGAGTVEFLVQGAEYFFLEMNTRLQVEHPVTEAVTGLDLVEWQLRVARGEPLPLAQSQISSSGHAIEARVVAEDPVRGFLPVVGEVQRWWLEDRTGVRVDGWVEDATQISPHFDSLLAKVIAHGRTRVDALNRLRQALRHLEVHGLATNRDQLVATLTHPAFERADVTTGFLDDHPEVIAARPDEIDAMRRCVAATLVTQHRPAVGCAVTFGPSGWRNIAGAVRTETWTLADGTHRDVSYEPRPDGTYEVNYGGRSSLCRLAPTKGSTFSLDIDGVTCQLRIHQYDGAVSINDWRGQSTFHVGVVPSSGAEKYVHDGTAPLPAVVVDVLVGPGTTVTKGEPVVILEAMKMQYTVSAVCSGVVATVYAVAGDSVAAGQILVEIAQMADGRP